VVRCPGKQARLTRQRRDQLIRDYITPRFDGVKAKKFTADPKASVEFLEGYYALLQSCRFNNVRGTNVKARTTSASRWRTAQSERSPSSSPLRSSKG
jgi:hypothetical protein